MDTFFEAFASILSFFYGLTHNYALAITMLTLVVMVVVTPLTLKGTRSMMVMQQMQPEMKKIQQRHKDDRQKLNEELMKFYKENNINPLGGCLPLIIQMPIFLVLYQVLRGLTRRIPDLGFNTGWLSGQLGTGLTPSKPPSIARPFDPAFLDKTSEMYQSLNGNTVMSSPPFNIDLAESARQAWSRGFGHALPFIVLIIVVGVTGFIQQRQIQGRAQNAQTNPQQQMIMKIMPIFLPFISISLPAGLVLYFAVSNLYRIAQQAFISRSIYGPGSPTGGAGDSESTPVPNGGFTARLKELVPALRGPDGDTPNKEGRVEESEASASDTPRSKSKGSATSSTTIKGETKGGTKGKGGGTNKTTKAGGGSKDRTNQSSQKQKKSSGTPTNTPTLQPRARKNKKR